MENSTTITIIATALLKAQQSMGNAIKDSENPFFKSKYADLNSVREACIPALNANGITALQPMVHIAGKNFIQTVLLHESGEYLTSLTEIIYSKQNDAQSQGSGISYARRYGLQSMTNVGAYDDDGHTASQPIKVENKPEKPKAILTNPQSMELLKGCKNLDVLKQTFLSLTPAMQIEMEAFKNELKEKLTPKK